MSDSVIPQGNRSEDGLVRINEFGKVEITLFPSDRYGYSSCNSEELKTIIRDMWRFFQGSRREGTIHGRKVRVRYTSKNHLKTVSLVAGFFKLVMTETKKKDPRMALFRLEIPFDATVGGGSSSANDWDYWAQPSQSGEPINGPEAQWQTSKPRRKRGGYQQSEFQW